VDRGLVACSLRKSHKQFYTIMRWLGRTDFSPVFPDQVGQDPSSETAPSPVHRPISAFHRPMERPQPDKGHGFRAHPRRGPSALTELDSIAESGRIRLSACSLHCLICSTFFEIQHLARRIPFDRCPKRPPPVTHQAAQSRLSCPGIQIDLRQRHRAYEFSLRAGQASCARQAESTVSKPS